MVRDRHDSQPSYRRNKHEIRGAREFGRAHAADGGADQVVDAGCGAEEYVTSVVVAIRGGH